MFTRYALVLACAGGLILGAGNSEAGLLDRNDILTVR